VGFIASLFEAVGMAGDWDTASTTAVVRVLAAKLGLPFATARLPFDGIGLEEKIVAEMFVQMTKEGWGPK
jgi:hypothetical protein